MSARVLGVESGRSGTGEECDKASDGSFSDLLIYS